MRRARLFSLTLAGALVAGMLATAEPPPVLVPVRLVPPVADPADVKAGDEIKASEQYVTLIAVKNAKSIVYVGLSGVEPLPPGLLKDPRQFVLDTRGLAAGRYGFVAVAASADGDQTRVPFTVVVGDGKVAPKPNNDAVKPAQKIGKLVIVNDSTNQKASFLVNVYQSNQAFNTFYEKGRRDAGWERLTAVDKDVKDKNGNAPKALAPLLEASAGKTYPQYFVLAPDGTVLEQGDLPTDPAALITKLQNIQRN